MKIEAVGHIIVFLETIVLIIWAILKALSKFFKVKAISKVKQKIKSIFCELEIVQKHSKAVEITAFVICAMLGLLSIFLFEWWSCVIIYFPMAICINSVNSKRMTDFFMWLGILFVAILVFVLLSYVWYYVCGGWMLFKTDSILEIIGFSIISVATLIILIGIFASPFR